MTSFWDMFGRNRSEERATQIRMEKEKTEQGKLKKQRLPDWFIDKYFKKGIGCKFLGRDVKGFTKTEHLAALGWFADNEGVFEGLSSKDIKYEIQKLQIKDGDIVILTHPAILSEGARVGLKVQLEKSIREFSEKTVKFVLLEEGMKINTVLSAGDSKDDPDFNVKAPKHEYVISESGSIYLKEIYNEK